MDGHDAGSTYWFICTRDNFEPGAIQNIRGERQDLTPGFLRDGVGQPIEMRYSQGILTVPYPLSTLVVNNTEEVIPRESSRVLYSTGSAECARFG
jgi:hypothetical protein